MAHPGLFQRLRRNAQFRFAMFVLGVLMMLVSPLLGALPGPGFIILFPLGLALVLQNSVWAKRRYVDFKRRHPRYGQWVDRGLRRKSFERRVLRARKDDDNDANLRQGD